jgi:hypothetical protein
MTSFQLSLDGYPDMKNDSYDCLDVSEENSDCRKNDSNQTSCNGNGLSSVHDNVDPVNGQHVPWLAIITFL